MIIGPSAQGPVVLALGFADRQIVDAGMARIHQSLVIEFPVLISVGSEPVSRVVVVFVCKAYCDPVLSKGPQFFDEPVVEFPRPFSLKEGDESRSRLVRNSALFLQRESMV